MSKTIRLAGSLLLIALWLAWGTAAMAAPAAVSLSVNKTVVSPGEPLTVSFSISPALPNNAWIGIIPSQIPHGNEAVNDQHDITYQYLQGRSRGTMSFIAPTTAGKYDFRMHNTDDNGIEIAFVSFKVTGHPNQPAAIDQNHKPAVTAHNQGATISINKHVFHQGEKIRVLFSAPSHYASNAWIGIIPAQIPHGSEAVNDQHDITYQYINKRTRGEMVFTAPHAGQWDLRLHDTDDNGREITHISFTVR